LFLAAGCLSEVRNKNAIASIATQLLDRLKNLIGYGNYARALRPFDEEELNSIVKIRTQALRVIITTWKEESDTLLWLKHRAQNDDDGAVRRAAIQELARGWKNEPAMFEFLCNVSLNDIFVRQGEWEHNPRKIALYIIIEQYGNIYPQRILSLLSDRTANDPDEKVREFAKNKLAELKNNN
jgi:hypothetical protein